MIVFVGFGSTIRRVNHYTYLNYNIGVLNDINLWDVLIAEFCSVQRLPTFSIELPVEIYYKTNRSSLTPYFSLFDPIVHHFVHSNHHEMTSTVKLIKA